MPSITPLQFYILSKFVQSPSIYLILKEIIDDDYVSVEDISQRTRLKQEDAIRDVLQFLDKYGIVISCEGSETRGTETQRMKFYSLSPLLTPYRRILKNKDISQLYLESNLNQKINKK